MFKKILIANRGEIAVRICATCREMGIKTVAIYSEADRRAQHVYKADEAYCVGPAPASQSYLCGDKIIAIALQSGAEAIHPGYGFLSENADFAEACEQAGLIFIGPSASAMLLMGSKITAKQLAQSVEAPTVPGYDGEAQDDETLFQEAERIGFPLLIKASAGGGGKGMRSVATAEIFLEQLAGARREAQAAFADGTVFLERLIQNPRHIEIQILGDQHGNIIHLGERECSIQRRHQKIVEESPSVALTPELRASMGETAVRIARAAGYTNAGTLEFMLDQDRQFYFLEMNTRLQVEHPVTELVTGLDLVRQQLLIAAGQSLKLTQDAVQQRGHAIEVRLYAEDPYQGFLPSTGTIEAFIPPEGPGIRLDSGIQSGDEVTQYYDPMLAKLIVYGEDREAAVERLTHALEDCAIFGVTSNLSLLDEISQHPAFRAGETSTNFLDLHRELLTLSSSNSIPNEVIYAAAMSELQGMQGQTQNNHVGNAANPWQNLGPWRLSGSRINITYHWKEQVYKVALQPEFGQAQCWKISINDQADETIEYQQRQANEFLLRQKQRQSRLYVQRQKDAIVVAMRGQSYQLGRQIPPDVTSSAHGADTAHTQKALTAPMAGTLIKVHVQNGDIVQANQVLAILSAMKMEHAITAPYDGQVQRVHFQEGAVVTGGAVIVEME